MHLTIRTVEKELFSGQVDSVQLSGSMGRFEVLANHAPLVSSLVKGLIVYTDSVGVHDLSVRSGVVEVLANRIRVLISDHNDIVGKK